MRHTDGNQFTLWLMTSTDEAFSISANGSALAHDVVRVRCQRVGEHAYIQLVSVRIAMPEGEPATYSIHFSTGDVQQRWEDEQARLLYPGQRTFSVAWQPKLTNVFHGSCRKPHHPTEDALLAVDEELEKAIKGGPGRPDLLLMTGDQIYADDVCGPMLQAVQQIVALLGLYEEKLEGAVVECSNELPGHPHNYYEREKILPQIAMNTALSKLFFGAKQKPVFTSVNAQNHLISCAEVIAMYSLVWSEALWSCVSFSTADVPAQYHARFEEEATHLRGFIEGLPRVRRALAHIPVYMIFDDHDVTDDWNLTRGWEDQVYGHPLSRRMVGNALIGYWLCQGWGNQPDEFDDIANLAQDVFNGSLLQNQDAFIDALFEIEHWHYQLATTPPVQVLDTRTRRWRSESNPNKPSGLMDWEALCELQQSLIGHEAVIVVSAAPIYGVKMIEAIQKVFTFFGKALTVDAENWMAHRGTAQVILNIFRHFKTPPEFIILSGDVHYSFVYDVTLRFRRNSPHIVQFTCSGIKNTFPPSLLKWLERMNRWFYGPKSPLNIFTRRRNMSVKARLPHAEKNKTLFNSSAIGQLRLTPKTGEIRCLTLSPGAEKVEFTPDD